MSRHASVTGAALAEAIRRISKSDLYRKGYAKTRSEAELLSQWLEEAARRLEAAK